MNANQIVNMVVRMVMRKLLRSGVDAGVNAVSKRMGQKPGADGKPVKSGDTQKRAKQTVKMMRRLR